jgi:hypothetical protein
MQALNAAAEAQSRWPMRHNLQQLEYILQQHYIAVSEKLAVLDQVRSEEGAVQTCKDLAIEAAGLLAACEEAIQRVT